MALPAALVAAPFADSVGVGSYRIAICTPAPGATTTSTSVPSPSRFLWAPSSRCGSRTSCQPAKTLGVTHITNGCYRLHPVEWNIGEAAGSLAARALDLREPPRKIRNDPRLLADFQRDLEVQGIEFAWPRLTPR